MIEYKKYLERLGISSKPEPGMETLRKLQRSHLLNIPFENLDIHYGRKIVLDVELLFGKIVEKKRGGFCYELNGMFFELLAHLGFDVKRVSARVNNGNGGFGPEFDHFAIIARVDGKDWLTDVGFGEFSFSPLEVIPDRVQEDERGIYKLERFGFEHLALKKSTNGNKWNPEYIFSAVPRELSDFSEMCVYHQTSENSHFTRNKICSIATSGGRITLSDRKLEIREGKTTESIPVRDIKDFEDNLKKYFGISMTEIH